MVALVAGMLPGVAGIWWLVPKQRRPLVPGESRRLRGAERLAGAGTAALSAVAAAYLWTSPAPSGLAPDGAAWPVLLGAASALLGAGVGVVAGLLDGRLAADWPTAALLALHLGLVAVYGAGVALTIARVVSPDAGGLMAPIFTAMFAYLTSERLRREGAAERRSGA